MIKKEIIIKAWMELNIETPFGICDKTGWVHGYFCNGIDDIVNDFGEITDQIEYDIEYDGLGKFRPKSLQGLENNNGWIKIESEDDFPNEEIDCFFIKGKQMFTGIWDNGLKRFYSGNNWISNVFHYQEIKRPDLPLY
jgi:hypothetical protein